VKDARRRVQEPRAAPRSGGEHRSAYLLLRLGSPPDWTVGQEVAVAVDIEQVHFFDCYGRRLSESPLQRPPDRPSPGT
jgi:hypothetical protein